MKFFPSSIGLIFAVTLSCHDEAPRLCDSLKKDLVDLNTAGVKEALDPWLIGLLPQANDIDHTGHSDNLNYFMDQLRSVCDLEVEWGCYECIETHPAQSEIIIQVDSLGQQVDRVLDILTPADDIMTIRDVHQ